MKVCNSLLSSIYFAPNELRACCKRFHVDGKMKGDAVLLSNPSQDQINLDYILSLKQRMLEELNSIHFDESHQCHGCPWIVDTDDNEGMSPLISVISIEMSSVCNMRCSYCSDTYYGGKTSDYKIDTFLESIICSSNDISIMFGGGEPVINPEFGELFKIATSRILTNKVRVFTNATVFNAALSQAIQNNLAIITTSIDAGTRETFKTVRGLDAYDKVIANLSRYAELSAKSVYIKYIFCDLNNNSKDVEGFLQTIRENSLMGCNFQISSDFKVDHLQQSDIALILKMKSDLDQLAPGRVFLDDHLAPRLISSSCIDFVSSGQYIVWGTGEHARRIFERIGTDNVEFFTNSTSQGNEIFMDKHVLPKEAILHNTLPVYIASVQSYSEIYLMLAEMGCVSRVVTDVIV